MKTEFVQHVFEKTSNMENFMKIRPVGAKSFHADGQTDRHETPSTHFLQFCERA